MGKDEFRRAIFDIVEHLTESRLTAASEKLLMHYFNSSTGSDSRSRAIEAIERYLSDELPAPEQMPDNLARLWDTVIAEAKKWDNE